NLFEITFDGQSAIVGKRLKGASLPLGADTAWIGQNPDSGFLQISPWIVDDPGWSDASAPLAQRRQTLAASGAHLLPEAVPACATATSFGACANGYRESVIHADLELPDGREVASPPDASPRVTTAFGQSLQVNASDGSAHRWARVAAHAGNVYVAW